MPVVRANNANGCGWPTEYCEFCDGAERYLRELDRLERVRKRLEPVQLPASVFVPHPWDSVKGSPESRRRN
jgi:hypothetical protein